MNEVAMVSSVRPPRFVRGPLCQDQVWSRSLSCACVLGDRQWSRHISYLLDSDFLQRVGAKSRYASMTPRLDSFGMQSQFRLYSSKGDGKNTGEEKHASGEDVAKFDNQKTLQEMIGEQQSDAHARLVDLDQKEWLENERLAMDSNKTDSPFRREKFVSAFMRRIVSWEKIHVSWDNFPYYINEHAKSTLVECAAAHLKHKELSGSHGARLASSSGRILLQSVPGTMLYRERIVRALAQHLQVPLLILDSSVLAPQDFNDDYSSERESDDNSVSGADTSESDNENDAANEEEWTSSNEMDDNGDGLDNNEVEMRARAEAALNELGPFIVDMEKRLYGEVSRSFQSFISESTEHSATTERKLKKGDHIKYIGQGSARRNILAGQRGVVFEVRGDEVAVKFDVAKDNKEAVGESEKKSEEHLKWVHVKEIEHDPDTELEDSYIVIKALSEVLDSVGPLIVYFPDLSVWLSEAVPKSERKDFVHKVEQMFDQLSGPAVIICGRSVLESKEKGRPKAMLPGFERLAKLHLGRSDDGNLYELFTNVLSLSPPKEEQLRSIFNNQIEEDRKIVRSRYSFNQLKKVFDKNNLSCMELLDINSDGVVLTEQKAEKVVGWAKNHHLSNCSLPTVRGGCLVLPRESLEIAILRLKEQETISRKQAQTAQDLKNLAKDQYEANFVSAVVPPAEIGVKFDDVGALEDVKTTLNELVILPMRRPELFTRGNLLRPCKGILLFGPPGTGKTLIAKALATEAGANFISVTGSTLTSKWFGESEKFTKALFSFASKLAPVIIFIDEVDSLLGARGGASEHEGTRRMKNEFMAAWDGLRSKDSQRVLILGATNRPFDLDDAVIRRLPRRIYVDLPDASNRLKILKIMLAQEKLEPGFQFEALADATDGYSGSDLKNLCIAAAYRPVQEFLEEERKGAKDNRTTLRALKVDDFIQSKSKVGPSVSNDALSMNELRKWNEEYGEGGSRKKSPFGFAIR